MREFVRIVTGGSPRDIGFDIGRACAGVIRELVAENSAFYKRLTGRSLAFVKKFFARNFLPAARRKYPAYLEELEGMAEGAGVAFEDLAPFSAEEEFLDLWEGWDKCTSAAVRTRRGFYLLHNEDYIGRYRNRLLIIDAAPTGKPAFLSLAYPGTLAGSSCGLNGAGLAFSGNSLHFRPRRRGIPKNFILRDILAAASLDAVSRKSRVQPRALGGNVTAVSVGEKKAVYVETSLKESAVVEIGESDILAHTNHVRSPKIDTHGEKASWNSRLRLAGAEFLLEKKRDRASLPYLMSVLSSRRHQLLHCSPRPDRPCTLASVIIDPVGKKMYVANRGTSDQRYKEYRLTAGPIS